MTRELRQQQRLGPAAVPPQWKSTVARWELASVPQCLEPAVAAARQARAEEGHGGPNIPDETIRFGRHAGHTFAEVRSGEPGYCRWVLRQERPSPALAEFARYLHDLAAPAGGAGGTGSDFPSTAGRVPPWPCGPCAADPGGCPATWGPAPAVKPCADAMAWRRPPASPQVAARKRPCPAAQFADIGNWVQRRKVGTASDSCAASTTFIGSTSDDASAGAKFADIRNWVQRTKFGSARHGDVPVSAAATATPMLGGNSN